jgi:leader peptidase (prepilin peptidase)/N-methyltransferase
MASFINALKLMPDWFWLVVFGCFGAILGSYVNMAAYRLPRGISTVTRTRSFCPACKAQLAWFENIPIFSYLALLGHCRHCRCRISPRYLIVELLVAALFCLSAYQYFTLNHALALTPGFAWWRLTALLGVQCFLIVDLVLLAVVDFETWLIPEQTTLPWIGLGFILAAVFPELHAAATIYTSSRIGNALIDSFIGLVLGAGALWAVGFATTVFTFFLYRLTNRPERPKEGMGLGDVHLMGMVGAMLGWKAVLSTLFLGVFLGCITGITKISYEKFQRWRLGEKYKPWQPSFELPAEAGAEGVQVPRTWPLFVMGVVVLLSVGWLHEQSSLTFQNQICQTLEETQARPGSLPLSPNFDLRLLPLAVMLIIGLTLIFAVGFLKYLLGLDQLPQGSIIETDEGKKEEVYQGHYVPFGPSLALAALLAVFYDPLLRNFAFWFTSNQDGAIPAPAYHVIGENAILHFIAHAAAVFNGVTHHILGG